MAKKTKTQKVIYEILCELVEDVNSNNGSIDNDVLEVYVDEILDNLKLKNGSYIEKEMLA